MPAGIYNRKKAKFNRGCFKKGSISSNKGKVLSAITKTKISLKAQERYKDKTKHPMYGSGYKRLGINNSNWKGGRTITSEGYLYIYQPNHPNATIDGYVFEHRLIMERHLGRTLLLSEIVHHINGDKKDNRIENLMLFSSNNKHSQFHSKEREKANVR